MDKESYRRYLERVFDYLNVYSVLTMYNEQYPDKKIDYSNLISFVSRKEYNKISEKRLENLTYFIKQNVGLNMILENNKEKHIIEKSRKELKKDIIEIIKEFKGE